MDLFWVISRVIVRGYCCGLILTRVSRDIRLIRIYQRFLQQCKKFFDNAQFAR